MMMKMPDDKVFRADVGLMSVCNNRLIMSCSIWSSYMYMYGDFSSHPKNYICPSIIFTLQVLYFIVVRSPGMDVNTLHVVRKMGKNFLPLDFSHGGYKFAPKITVIKINNLIFTSRLFDILIQIKLVLCCSCSCSILVHNTSRFCSSI